jgi:glycosyltransferase involved in cell wall biosynthesis
MTEANLVIPQSRWMKEYLIGKGIFKKKMLPHSMGVNINFFSPKISGARIRTSLKLENSSVLVYVGNMNRLRKLSILIECLSIVRNEVENVKLLMVGDGDDRTNLENLVQKYNLHNEVIFTGQIPYSEVRTYIAAADICLSPIPLDPVFQISSPTKLFEYMAMGKPLVASEIPEQKEVLLKSRAGLCVPFQVKEFSKAICYLLENEEVAREMGLRGRNYVSKYNSFSYLGEKLLSWYEHLIKLQ